ncbi:NAD-dependent epimerase/dehydratase family protein [Lacibacter sp. MH-610]|uniref:NAD-dependent epimerase/dehydratase family protein n=1 Tax=Lacibacter sp. MH-610 TaxID=3020883 RepID=UPI003891CEF3
MIFVTGGAGLVGAALLKQLLRHNKGPIKALYRNQLPVLLSKEELEKIQWVKGDVLDTSVLYEELKGCKQVYHCAAVVSYHQKRREQMYRINIDGTANMVNASLENGIEKFLQVSSVAAIGRIRKGEWVNEETKWTEETNNSHYGKTKYLSELEVWRGIGEGLNAVMVNPSIILGESTWEAGSTALFKNAWNEFPWYTNGSTGYVDAQDVAKAMVGLMESNIKGERFILSHEHFTYRELLTKIANAFGKQPPKREAKPWMGALVWRLEHLKSLVTGKEPLLTKETTKTAQSATFFSNEKIKKALPGFEFTPIDATIERTCSWLKEFYNLK